jgi:hypothetical protein
MVACKYLAVTFNYAQYIAEMKGEDGEEDWRRLRTPEIDKIMIDQGLSPIVQTWGLAFFGRLAYEVNEQDKWQIQLFLKGLAGTGKSTLLQQLVYLWDPSDVAILSNTTQKMFPLESLLNVFVYFGLDISSHFSLDQTLWQSMVSGEGIAVNRKHKDTQSVDWKVPGAFAGNENPPWKDKSGSVSRRLAIIAFMKHIGKSNPMLNEKLRANIGAFIMKISIAYMDLSTSAGDRSIWNMLPHYFKDTQKSLREETHFLQKFLNSGEVLCGPAYACPSDVFQRAFHNFCVRKERNVPEWSLQYYMQPFIDHNITIRNEVGFMYHGVPKTGSMEIYHGCDLRTYVERHAPAVAATGSSIANDRRNADALLGIGGSGVRSSGGSGASVGSRVGGVGVGIGHRRTVGTSSSVAVASARSGDVPRGVRGGGGSGHGYGRGSHPAHASRGNSSHGHPRKGLSDSSRVNAVAAAGGGRTIVQSKDQHRPSKYRSQSGSSGIGLGI